MFTPGQKVEWLYEPRGGYGYRFWVAAVVVKVGPARVTIEAPLATGGTRRVAVRPDKLRLPTSSSVVDCHERR